MQNNLKWLIAKSGMSTYEFGRKIFPKMKDKTHIDKIMIMNKVRHYSNPNLKTIPLDLIEKIAATLGCDYNELFGYKH